MTMNLSSSTGIIIIIFSIIKVCQQHRFLWLPLIIPPSQTLLLAGPQDCIKCLHIADEYKFWLVSPNWCVHVQESIGECYLWVYLFFSNSVLHVLLILLGWFVRWEVSGCTAADLKGTAYWQYPAGTVTDANKADDQALLENAPAQAESCYKAWSEQQEVLVSM